MFGQVAFQRATDKSSKGSNKVKQSENEGVQLSDSGGTRRTRDVEGGGTGATIAIAVGNAEGVHVDVIEDEMKPTPSSLFVSTLKSVTSTTSTGATTSMGATTSATIRLAVLVLLCTQNASHVLMTRYSKGVLKETYSGTEVVLFGEIIKLFSSLYLIVYDRSSDLQGSIGQKIFWLLSHSKKIIVLVVLYTFANVLSYQALARVEASVYTVTSQMKIFTTAVFSVIFLGREISSAKWRALSLLVVACILVASPSFNQCLCDDDDAVVEEGGDENKNNDHSMIDTLLGVGCILVMTTISGFSAAYFEGMLKTETEGKVTIWERNFQLAFFSSFLLAWVVIYDLQNTPDNAIILFKGWTSNTVIIAIIQALGGLLVAAALKYADAVLKVLATAGSIVISSLFGWLLLGGSMDLFVLLGGISTILAIVNYTLG